MRENKEKELKIDRLYEDFINGFCPYGSHDIRFAMNTLIEIGEDEDYLLDLIDEFCSSTDSNRNKIDIVAVLYDGILNDANQELKELIGYDEDDIMLWCNYLDTNFSISDDDREKLESYLQDAQLPMSDFSLKTQYVLSEISAVWILNN